MTSRRSARWPTTSTSWPTTSTATAARPVRWRAWTGTTRCSRRRCPDLNPAHVLLGVPLYGRAWGTLGGASAYSNVLYNALSIPGARVDYDFSAQTPYIVSPNGSPHHVFRRRGQPRAEDRAGEDLRSRGDRGVAPRLRGPGILVALQRLSRLAFGGAGPEVGKVQRVHPVANLGEALLTLRDLLR